MKSLFRQSLLPFLLLLGALPLSAQNEALIRLPENIKAKDRICFALYTVHEGTLKLSAQFYPIQDYEPFYATLEIAEGDNWVKKAEAAIIYPGYLASFRIDDWDDTKEYRYRVNHNDKAFYTGIIRKNPRDKDEFVMAAFTCNSIYPQHGGDISKEDIVNNIQKLNVDLLFFSGDQVYDHSAHYLYWLKFGRDFGEIIRNTPTITIPDDHDVGQANLWGAGGKKARSRRGISGGYYMPVEYVKEVERAQTSHLPDPYDPTPIQQGIGVYYTDLKWGGISFAILEDRKFKSGLEGVIEHNGGVWEAILEPIPDPRKFDVTGATLLGDRQLDFLEAWTTDWEDAEMKTVLSQTIFAMGSNYSGKHGREIYIDFDANGWPQTGRNKALATIRKSYSCMVAGDQHLGTVIHHGIDDWNDAGYSFCTPAIANFWLRWWEPQQAGKNRTEGQANNLGEFYDGFQNKITMEAVANPSLPEIKEGGHLSTRAAGFGIVRYQKAQRKITFECWPRNVDITDPNSKQYAGWPIIIDQMDNYPMLDAYELPTLRLSKANQVLTVVRAYDQEVVSSLRIKGNEYQARVPELGQYSLIIGEGEEQTIIRDIQARKKENRVLEIE
ncbi:MAG: metallophosphoesterase family protein [Bacteroidota bacterium]